MLADAAAELREFVDHLQIPVAHTLMGKGALPDDHPLVARHDRLLGHEVHQRAVPLGRRILGLGTRFSEADCSSWEPEYTFNFPPTKLIHIDIDPDRDRPQLPGRDRRRRRLEAGADRAQPRRAPDRAGRHQAAGSRGRDRGVPRDLRRRQPRASRRATLIRCAPSASSPTFATCCRRTPSSRPTSAGTRTASGSSSRSTRQARSSRRAATRRWASAHRRRWAPSSRCPSARWSRWWATAASARTRRCSRRRSKRTSPSSG